MRTILISSFTFLLVSCSTTYTNIDPSGKTFPTISGSSLNGKEYTIPADFSGEKILLLVGFKRKSQFDIDRWTIGLDQTKTRVKTIELPATQGWFPILFNDMIDNGMRNGIPNELWKDVITVLRRRRNRPAIHGKPKTAKLQSNPPGFVREGHLLS